jgi:hypothetical protein
MSLCASRSSLRACVQPFGLLRGEQKCLRPFFSRTYSTRKTIPQPFAEDRTDTSSEVTPRRFLVRDRHGGGK